MNNHTTKNIKQKKVRFWGLFCSTEITYIVPSYNEIGKVFTHDAILIEKYLTIFYDIGKISLRKSRDENEK